MTRRDTKERERALFSEPDLLDVVVDRLAGGVVLTEVAVELGVRYSALYFWLHSDRERVSRYAKAMESRRVWMSETVVHAFLQLAQFDFRKLYDADGNLLPLHQLPEDAARALVSIDTQEGQLPGVRMRKVRVVDRLRALENLGRTVELFKDRLVHSGPNNGPIPISDRETVRRRVTDLITQKVVGGQTGGGPSGPG